MKKLFALFLKYFVTKHTKAGYEKIAGALFDEKISWMENTIQEWQCNKENSIIKTLYNH